MIDAQPFLGALARDPSLRGLAGALGLMAGPPGGAASSAETGAMGKSLGAVAEALQAARPGKATAFSWSALFSGAPPSVQDKRRFLQISPKLDYSELQPGAAASDALRATAQALELTPEHGYRVRLTGDIAMQDEEFGTLAEGAALNNGLMVAAVLLILWRACAGDGSSVAVMANMIVGLALTAAAGLAMVGVLNPISVAFAVLFVGIGVDFGIQFAVRYREERFQHRRAGQGAGPGRRRGQPAAGAGRGGDRGGVFLLHPHRLSRRVRARADRRRGHDSGVLLVGDPAAGAAGDFETAGGNDAGGLCFPGADRPVPDRL